MSIPTTTMRLDECTKQEAKTILEELGLNLSSVTNLFLKAILRCKGLPFSLQLAQEPVPAAMAQHDFTAEYLAPLLSTRNETNRVNSSPEIVKQRLMRKYETISADRHVIS